MVEWKKLSGSYYAISDGRILKSTSTKELDNIYAAIPIEQEPLLGFKTVRLSENIERRYVHNIILAAFEGEPEDGVVAVHIDGDRQNNNLSNLTYMKRKDYQKRISKMMRTGKKRKVLSCEEIKQIKREYIPYDHEHNIKALAKRFDTCIPIISRIVKPQNDNVRRQNDGILKFKGDRHFNSKLSKDDIFFIRENFKKKDLVFGRRPLANKFCVSEAHITRIINKNQWKNL